MASLLFLILRLLFFGAAWEAYAGSAAYDAILGGMSTGGIALASLVRYWVGEFANSVILSRMNVLARGKCLWAQTIGSTLAGEFLDSLAFVFIASLTGVFGRELFVTLYLPIKGK